MRYQCAAMAVLMVLSGRVCGQVSDNLCKNPGFELLNRAGDNLPLNWAAVQKPAGQGTATIDKTAHAGSIAIRMSATPDCFVGINSDPIPVTKGVVTFWYQIARSDSGGENLRLFMIAVDDDGVEAARAGYQLPAEHIGDGQWHQGRAEFDFSSHANAKAVIVAPRINEQTTVAAGEWLVDDVEVVSATSGPRPVIEALYLPRPVLQLDEPGELIVQVANEGVLPLKASRLRFGSPNVPTTAAADVAAPGKQAAESASDGRKAEEQPFEIRSKFGDRVTELPIPNLSPEQSLRMSLKVTGKRKGNVDIRVEWFGEGFSVVRTRRTVCVDRPNPRELCTGAGGAWRFMPAPVPLQENNDAALEALPTMKSSELPDSCIGVTAHLPRPHDFEAIFEPEHLIDGKPETSWSGRAHATAVPGSSEWVEVYFSGTSSIKELRLLPYWRAEGFPADFDIKARDRGSWKPVQQVRRAGLPPSAGEDKKRPYVITFPRPVQADAICIEATRFTPTASFFTDCATTYYFRLSEIEAISADDKNVAAAAAGASAKASWTFRSYFNSAEVIRDTYGELYNLGVKWNRVGQWGDWTCWSIVEQKKGEYAIDPTTDEAITESIRNGVNIVYCLCYGNALYEETPPQANPGPLWRHGHPFMGNGGPTKPESIDAFVNYARFVANHFRGRVKWYEIWNEQNSWAWYGSPPDPKTFGVLLRETAKAIKEVDPDCGVLVGGTAALAPVFLSKALAEGGGPHLDAVAFHPYGVPYPEAGAGSLDIIDGKQVSRSPAELGFNTHREMLDFLRRTFSPFNPHCEYWANEWNAIPTREDMPYKGGTEITEAKQAARFFLQGTLTGVRSVWRSLVNENTVYDWGILRTGEQSRKPVYYTIQAMTTLLSGAKADPTIKATATGDAPELRCETLRGRDGEMLVAVWSAISPQDDCAGKRVSVRIANAAGKSVDAVDTFHALVQKIKAKTDGDAMVIDGLLAMDYPVILRIR
ncbi:MAG: discoidin domain-containing protein [Phycisphaerae bacterium]|nr:discoidin domain-containing protein [Phycisphaerae bacterium]